MKSLLRLLLFAPIFIASCSSLPEEEVDALVFFREGEVTKLNSQKSVLLTESHRVEGLIKSIDTQILTLKDDRALSQTKKSEIEKRIEATEKLIEDNKERLEDLQG